VRARHFGNYSAVAASVYSRALQKAAELHGGRDALCKILQVPKADLDRWIADEAKPPRDIFLRVVDLILDETSASGDSDYDPPPPRDAAGADRHLED
jgi:hypothetical protein